MNDTTRFLYHAHGTALSGVIRRPFSQDVEAQATTMLPVTGGYRTARAEAFRIEHILSFQAAYTQVSGSKNQQDNTHTSLMSIVIEGLNVLDLLTADRIVARLSAKRDLAEPETRVVPLGTQFENLRIGGFPVNVELDLELFHKHDTCASFKDAYRQDSDFQNTVRDRFLWKELDNSAPDFLRKRYKGLTSGAMPEYDGVIPCSLVKKLECKCPGVTCCGNVIVVPNFGTIYLAEYRVQPHKRNITMLRMELGSPVEGSLQVNDGGQNGGSGG